MINILIITHGEFGAYLLEAAEAIVGAQKEGIKTILISPRLSFEKIKEMARDEVEKNKSGDGLIILTDIIGGTPTAASLPPAKDILNVSVISGVNLNMVISALSYRSKMPFNKLTAKIIEDGKKSVCDIKALFAGAKGEGNIC